MSAAENTRSVLHAAVSSVTPFDEEEADDEMPDAGVVVGWVIVAEWQGSDGQRWLSKVSADATGERRLPDWTERGLCAEVIFNWPEE